LSASGQRWCSAIAGFCAVLFLSGALAAQTLRDDLGRAIEVAKPAQRIVTLAPFLTELVFAAGAGERLVGVSAYSDYPPQAKGLPAVATAAGLSLEHLLALKPDLVIAWRDSIRPEEVERLSALVPAVYVAQARHLEDVPRLLKVIGVLCARDVSAVASEYERSLERLRRAYAAKPQVKAFLEIWHSPLTTISRNHFMSEALEICRAENIFADISGIAPLVSWEAVYARDPYVIVGAGSAASEREFRANWGQHPTLGAVKAGRLIFLDADTIRRPSPRIPEGIAQLCAALDSLRPARPRSAAP